MIKVILQHLRYVTKHFERFFALLLTAGIILSFLSAFLNPMLLKAIFDEATIHSDFKGFVLLALLAVAVFTGLRGLEFLYALANERFKLNLVERHTRLTFLGFFRTPYARLEDKDSSYYTSRIYEEVQKTVQMVDKAVLTLIRAVVTFAGGLIATLLISWQLTLVFALIVPGLMVASMQFSKRNALRVNAELEQEAQLRTTLTQTIRAFKLVRMYALLPVVERLLNNRLGQYKNAFYSQVKHSTIYTTLNRMVLSWVELLVIIGGGYGVMTGLLTFGGFMGFMSGFWISVNALRQVVATVPELSKFTVASSRIREFAMPAVTPEPGIVNVAHNIIVYIDNVRFDFKDKRIFDALTLQIKRGERVLLQGPNGSGKTTLVNLISGFLQPTHGQVQVHGRISAMIEPIIAPPMRLRDFFPVEQTTTMTTLLNQVGIAALRDKYYSELSLGQKKRFHLVLALLKDADLYILDEPFANVDEASQTTLLNLVLEQTTHKTLIVISHDSHKLKPLFNRIITLESFSLQKVV